MEFEFRADREAHLRMLCAEMGKSVDELVNEALLTFMEDYEDGRDAQAGMAEFRAGSERTYTTEELMREYGLEAGYCRKHGSSWIDWICRSRSESSAF